MAMYVEHIADVSLRDHFLGVNGEVPTKGEIQVNDNTFEVSFDNGKVNARFLSGNWFTNLFRSKTMNRFVQNLQSQYDSWVVEKAKAAQANFTANPNVAKVKSTVNDCFNIIYEARSSLDKSTLDCSKDALMAYAMPNANIALDEHDAEHFMNYCEVMPQNLGRYAKRLGQFAELATARNMLLTASSGTDADLLLLNKFGIKTHMASNCEGKSEEFKKRYLLSTIDSVIDGFLQAIEAMKDKKTELRGFLDKMDGVCLEAKSSNIQEWLDRSDSIADAARSTEKDDLANSVTAEFNAIASAVKAPFREEARKACEAEIREQCKKEGVEDEEFIQDRIETKVNQILDGKEKAEEINALVLQKLKTEGKQSLYENLVGAKRPVTTIENKDGKWTVSTLVDQNNNPILKNVSAFDIDKNFDKLVQMYMDDAVLMGDVEFTKELGDATKVGNHNDTHAEGVINSARDLLKDKGDMKKFINNVKSQMYFKPDMSDQQFLDKIKQALGDVTGTSSYNQEDTEISFGRLLNNFIDGSYADKTSDTDRLANIVARRIESMSVSAKNYTVNLDDKVARCVQLYKVSHPDKNIDVDAAKAAIKQTITKMVDNVFSPQEGANPRSIQSCKTNLNSIMFNGRLFSDMLPYDISHRPAGNNEIQMNKKFNNLMKCIEHYGKIDPSTFIKTEPNGVA